MPNQYLRNILFRETVPNGPGSRGNLLIAGLTQVLQPWANNFLLGISASGSFAKGTANNSTTDLDVFVSISPQCTNTLKEIYDGLARYLTSASYAVRKQNVSIAITYQGAKVDIVPGKRQSMQGTDHSIYRRKADNWRQTNIGYHIAHVTSSQRIEEIRILKLWRSQAGLDFPSFCLELFAITCLANRPYGALADNVWKALEYFASANFANARVIDPANTNNIVSDDLTAADRVAISAAASRAIKATNWSQIVR